ncbi:signal peptide peptidase SppA [Halostreptopolyspora alba]|uniref:Signal peptide peptidase SppA n=1 Tax=Halostreptopolyspora alba TaxID=2487137 RepID=A0A3N0EAH1_9ACTN|nr:signal peptide peptidase SppA [Nocardiopsaceae bacterium YIM 96095]
MVDAAKLIEPLSQLRHRRGTSVILELDLTEGVGDESPGDPISQIMAKRRQRLSEIVEGVRRGARDPRVRALIARIDGKPLGFAQVQELRRTVAAFRASGKPTVAWSESFGEVGPGTVPYYLATAFDEIALLPSGMLGLTGVSVNATFLRDTVEKLGVEYEVGARHEYKTAVNTFTERGLTGPHREATGRIVESLNEQITEGIAQRRGLTTERVRELTDRGPFLATEAVSEGLVDRLAYRDEIYADLLDRFRADDGTEEPNLQFVSRYQRRHAFTPRVTTALHEGYVALVSASGILVPGRSRRAPVGGSVVGSDTLAAAFRSARRDPRVRAVVFRVDSRGGSPVASDVIRREVRLTSEAGIPVIATMGDIAGSGGYYVTLGADAIVAHPGTLTGSIGVYMGKAVLSGLLGKLGISTESIDSGEHSGMFHSDRQFSESEWQRVNTMLDHLYDDFTAKVAEARGMTRERVHELARGRVWTGSDAHAGGLVDHLGGLDTAVRMAREKAGLPAGVPVRPYPQQSPLDRMKPAESSEDRSAARVRLDAWGAFTEVSSGLGFPAGGPLTMPGSWEIR